ADRNLATRRKSVGERVHRRGVRNLRVEFAGGIRDYPALGHADEARRGFAARRVLRNAAHGTDLLADVVRLRRTVRRTAAGIVSPSPGSATGDRHGGIRYGPRLAILLPGGVSVVFEEAP